MSDAGRPPLVDDGLLVRILVAGDPAAVPALDAPEVLTTGLWWYRLCRAVLSEGAGRLSTALAPVDPELRRAVVADLPPGVTVIGLSSLGPLAAETAARAERAGIRLNALAAEAAAVALDQGAEVLVSTPSPSLAAAAPVCGFGYRVSR